jgi:hypothetical protein
MLKPRIFANLFFLLLFLSGCGTNYGNKLESKELDIYFVDHKHEEQAKKIALYWKTNNLLGDTKQYLQLDKQKDVFLLKIIPTQKFEMEKFSFDERALLKGLQDSLEKLVAPNRLEIVIAKNNFESLYNIND